MPHATGFIVSLSVQDRLYGGYKSFVVALQSIGRATTSHL